MLTPFCTPLRSSYRHPATSLQPTPRGSAGRPLVPSFACGGPRNSRDFSFALGTPQARVRVRRPKNEALSFLGPKRTLLI